MKDKIQTHICDALEGKKNYSDIITNLRSLGRIAKYQERQLRSKRYAHRAKMEVLSLAMQVMTNDMIKIHHEIEVLK